MSRRVVIIAQARAGSTRLPRKAFRVLSCGASLTQFQVRGLRESRVADDIVLAVPDGEADNPFERIAADERVGIYRGSEADVLDRYYRAAELFRADIVVRVCGDNPLTDPAVIDRTVAAFRDEEYDYLGPAGLPLGTTCEVFSFEALRSAHEECSNPEHREHVTMHIYRHPERYRIGSLDFGLGGGEMKVTVDTLSDFEAVDALIQKLGGQPPIPVARVVVALKNAETSN